MTDAGLTLAAGAVALGDASDDELWLHYLSIGGRHHLAVMRRCIRDGTDSVTEHNLIAHAMNERLLDLGRPGFPVAYRQAPGEPSPDWPWAVSEGWDNDSREQTTDGIDRWTIQHSVK